MRPNRGLILMLEVMTLFQRLSTSLLDKASELKQIPSFLSSLALRVDND